ncbi:MAG: ABC transporter permease [Mariniblastus sp.]
MVVEDFTTFSEWIMGGAGLFGFIVLAGIVLGVFFGYLVASFRHGPFEAFYIVAQVIGQAIPDFIYTSPRRVSAIAGLAIKEALRRKVILVTFGIFAAMLLFGGWFMDAGGEHPDRIYINFVLWGTQLLVLLMGMLISAFSLPEDIKHKTIYTVVTKPVRSTEIVLGRIIGFGLLGTVLLLLMGLISFFFVWRGLSHEHQIVGDTQTLASFQRIPDDKISLISGRRASDNAVMEAETNTVAGHSHRIELIEDIREEGDPEPRVKTNIIDTVELDDGRTMYRRVVCNPIGGHTHQVTIEGQGDNAKISLGPAVGYFRARVPIYSDEVQFYDRNGTPGEGTNVGKEWGYRGYINGGDSRTRTSLAKAEFTFSDFDKSKFPDNDLIPLEMTLGVFRTYKADIQKRVTGGIQFRSIPDSELDNVFVSDVVDFETSEFSIQTLPISRKVLGKLQTPDGKLISTGKYDLFDDFAPNGKVSLAISCRDMNQYLGVARGDVYFRAGDQLYWVNFLKGYLGIWCQMMIIIAMGVAFSTFLSAPVVMLGTIVMIIVGFFTTFIREMTAVDAEGGGPIESFVRVVTQQNMVLDLDTGILTTAIEQIDLLLIGILNAITYLAPDFSALNFSDFLTYGYAINNDRIFVAVAITLAFCMGLTVLGYFALKTREIAK